MSKIARKKLDEKVLAQLRGMGEVELCRQVLEPLLQQMATHVEYVHGAQERGKDFIYVTEDSYGDPVLEVAQVKNSPFTGKSGHRSHTLTVLNQLLVCRKTKVRNRHTGKLELPQSVVLWSTYDVPEKDAANADRFFDELQEARCKIIGPQRFVSLLRRYVPDLYEKFALPGEGLIRSLHVFLNIHHEASAFGIERVRLLGDFFVHLGVSPSQRDFTTHVSHTHEGRRRVEIAYAPGTMGGVVSDMQSLWPPQGADAALLQLLKRRSPVNIAAGSAPEGDIPLRLAAFAAGVQERVTRLTHQKKRRAFLTAVTLLTKGAYVLQCASRLVPDEGAETVDSVPALPFEALAIEQIPPSALLQLRENACIFGEAGCGKTSVARMLTRAAIVKGIPCVYFPCSRLTSENADLRAGIRRFLQSLAPKEMTSQAGHLVDQAALIVLDGCDEAASFRGRLGNDIRRLAFRKATTCKSRGLMGKACVIPGDLADRVLFDQKSGSIRITKPVLRWDFERLLRLNPAREMAAALRRIAFQYESENPQIIVTSRSPEVLGPLWNFCRFRLRPFSEDQRKRFFRRWFRRAQPCTQIEHFLEEHDHVREICQTPMIATLVAALHENGYDLPHSMTELYAKYFDLLLDKWDRVKRVPRRTAVTPGDKLMLLMRLALRLHLAHRRTFRCVDLANIWQRMLNRPTTAQLPVDDLIWELRVVNNVIVPEGMLEHSLGHLSFQEFLTARAIWCGQFRGILEDKFFDPWWENVIVFYAGLCGDVSAYLGRLLKQHALEEGRGLLSRVIAEARYTNGAVTDFVTEASAEELMTSSDLSDSDAEGGEEGLP